MPSLETKSLSVVSLWTDKMEETIDFYSRVLGLKECACSSYHMHPTHFIFKDAFLVLLKGKQELEEGSEPFPVIAITVDNLENACQRLEENGIKPLKGIQEDESSRWTLCRDPGNNLIELCIWK
jgi:predicted enzyme related to lactoylglutathione lyase